MAKERLTLYDKYGNERDVDMSTEDVTLDNEGGKSLKTKLSEIDDAFDESVTKVVFNGETKVAYNGEINIGNQMQPDWSESSTSYPSYIRNKPTIPTKTSELQNDAGYITSSQVPEGITVDNAMSSTSENAVQNKVIKAYVDNLISGLVNGAPQALDTLNELAAALGNNSNFAATITQQLASKISGIQTHDGTPLTPQNGIVTLPEQTEGEAVSVTTNQDGTFTIHVGETDYTINLNHTHENMAKIVKCTEATRPQTLENDTIYVQVDNATTPTEIESLWLFGLEFTAAADTTPRLTAPSTGSTIDVGTNEGAGVTFPIPVKGRNLSQALTATLSGTDAADFSLSVNSISANDANTGTTLSVTYNGTAASATAVLTISSSEINVTCSLTASYEMGDQSYSESEAKAAFQDSTLNNKWLKADASAIGSAPAYTNDGQGAQGCYILKVPLAGVAVLRYPMFKSSSGFGSVICDANGNVVWQFANAICNDGVMNTVDVANIAGASYALIQLYNSVTGYTIEISGNLYYGMTYDKAMVALNVGYVDAAGYCVSNGYPFDPNHVYKINAGFTQSPNGNNLFGLKFLGVDGNSNKSLYSVDNNHDSNGIMSVTPSSTDGYGKMTFKISELDDCYIYDDTAGVYLFKGRNVNTNNS